MHLDVLLFASAADAFGAPTVRLDLPEGATAGAVRGRLLATAAERGAALPPGSRLAVNHAFAADRDPVAAGDEVALIPPVAGG